MTMNYSGTEGKVSIAMTLPCPTLRFSNPKVPYHSFGEKSVCVLVTNLSLGKITKILKKVMFYATIARVSRPEGETK